MLFWTFRVNKRPTNVGADDWFVKCYENGMDHRLNRLLNPTFNNKNMEVRYCFFDSFRLKSPKSNSFFAYMYVFLNFLGLRQILRRWKNSRNLTATDRQINCCGAWRYVNSTTSRKQLVYSQNLKFLLKPHLFCPQGRQKLWHGTRTLNSYARAQDLKWSYGRGYYDTPGDQN